MCVCPHITTNPAELLQSEISEQRNIRPPLWFFESLRNEYPAKESHSVKSPQPLGRG